jgi:biotin synthase-related radical SAM superfamily protein
MRTHTAAHNDSTNGVDTGLRDLTSSMIRFTNAVTLFSMQQMQNAIGAVTDSQAVINRFCNALDAISNTLSTQIDASKKSTLDSMSKTGTEMVDRTMDAMNLDALNPREIMDTTADVMRKTSDSVADIVRRASNTGKHGHQHDDSGEPESAADALGKKKSHTS